MDIHHLRRLISEDFEEVTALIYNKIQSEISLIDDLANHIVQSGGKRLRPLLILLASKACGYQGKEHIKLAAMVEFFHTATLLHDDVVDESKLRRGQKTANEIWGSKASILVGDFLFTQYMQLMISVGDLEIMQLLTDIAYQIGCGELSQLSNRNKVTLTEEEYFKIIEAKTSILFAACAIVGAMISKSNSEIQKNMYDFGLHLGNAFQLIDDALDYCSDAKTIGKNIGDDLADGKATLPILYALKHAEENQKDKIRLSVENGTLEYLPEVLATIEATKAIDYTKRLAAFEVDKAISCLHILPNSPYKDCLIDLAKYAINRDH